MAALRFSMSTIGQPQMYANRPMAFAYSGCIEMPVAGVVTSAAVFGSTTCPAVCVVAAAVSGVMVQSPSLCPPQQLRRVSHETS